MDQRNKDMNEVINVAVGPQHPRLDPNNGSTEHRSKSTSNARSTDPGTRPSSKTPQDSVRKRKASEIEDDAGQSTSRNKTPESPNHAKRSKHSSTSSQSQTTPTHEVIQVKVTKSNKPITLDHHTALVSLADQYITAARSMSRAIVQDQETEDVEHYQKLISKGLSCLAASLKHWTLTDPKYEAHLRLRYATLLYDETENDDEAIDILTQGIAICERSRFIDVKYSMQHLLARIQFEKNFQAAFKTIDNLIDDANAYTNTIWIYSSRLFRISLALRSFEIKDMVTTLTHIRALGTLAQSKKHVAIFVFSQLLEVFLHVRYGHADAYASAQRAITAARTHQLDPTLKNTPQLRALFLLLDICVDLKWTVRKQINSKLAVFQEMIDQISEMDDVWTSGTWDLPTSIKASEDMTRDTCELIKSGKDSRCTLTVKWINKNDMLVLAFMICASSSHMKDMSSEKTDGFLREGLNYAKRDLVSGDSNKSLQSTVSNSKTENELRVAMELFEIIRLTLSSNWHEAQSELSRFLDAESYFGILTYGKLLYYVEAIVSHGSGELETALSKYKKVIGYTDKRLQTGLANDMYLLAKMNMITIFASMPDRIDEAKPILAEIEPICKAHHDIAYQAAGLFLKTLDFNKYPVYDLRSDFGKAINLSKDSSNLHILAVIMANMTTQFFDGIIGTQTEKSALVRLNMARKVQSPLLMAGAHEFVSKVLLMQGKVDSAEKDITNAMKAMDDAPEKIREKFLIE